MSVLAGKKGNLILINDFWTDQMSAEDRGLFYGDGLFETLAFTEGQIGLWSFHKSRLLESCSRLDIELAENRLIQAVSKFLTALSGSNIANATLKIIVTRGVGGRGYSAEGCTEPTLAIYAYPKAPHSDVNSQEGIKLYSCQQRVSQNKTLAGLKHCSKLDYILARNEWFGSDCQEGLVFDPQGNVVECSFSNLFLVKNGELITPDLSKAGVEGVMRRFTIEHLAPQLNLTVKEIVFCDEELRNASEVFSCNSLYGFWPVLHYKQLSWPKGKVVTALQSLLKSEYPSFCAGINQL